MTAARKGVTREMMQFLIRLTSRQTVAAIATACAMMAPLSSANAQDLPFLPPKGWVSVKVPTGLIGKWVKPGVDTFHQNMSVYAHKYDGTLTQYYVIDVHSLEKNYPGGDLAVSEDTTVCSNHAAKYVSYGLNTNAGPLIVEQIMTVQKSIAYVVTYVRLASETSDPAARHAMTTMCGI
jgi:hypothetical protein